MNIWVSHCDPFTLLIPQQAVGKVCLSFSPDHPLILVNWMLALWRNSWYSKLALLFSYFCISRGGGGLLLVKSKLCVGWKFFSDVLLWFLNFIKTKSNQFWNVSGQFDFYRLSCDNEIPVVSFNCSCWLLIRNRSIPILRHVV